MPKKRQDQPTNELLDNEILIQQFEKIAGLVEPVKLTHQQVLNILSRIDKRQRSGLGIEVRDLFRYECEIYNSNCGTALRFLRNDTKAAYSITEDEEGKVIIPPSQYRYLIFNPESIV